MSLPQPKISSPFGKFTKTPNTFFLTLIPNTQSPSFGEFSPISLLKFSDIIISKTLASRPATVLPKLIC